MVWWSLSHVWSRIFPICLFTNYFLNVFLPREPRVCACQSKCDLWPDTFHFNLLHSAHRRRRCGVGCCGCCRGKNHLRMPAPPVRCRLLALEYKPRSGSSARPLRRHDFTRLRTDFQPPNSDVPVSFGVLLCCSKTQK